MKADAAEIEAFVKELASRPGIAGTTRAPWPQHLFRIDDVQAAANVLERGELLSRERAAAANLIKHDSAHPGVMSNAPDWLKKCVRLYFRPKTPTEYNSEGFRPRSMVSGGAHRPMPVILVFASVPILCLDGTAFTNGNATSAGRPGSTVAYLRSIPFDLVYHEGPFTSDEKAAIIHSRCAEVLVQERLDLTHLRRVLCRSQAELETLLDLLSPATRQRFAKIIGISVRSHHKKWTFLESVEMKPDHVVLNFSQSTLTPGPFEIRFELFDEGGAPRGTWRNSQFLANKAQKVILTNRENLGRYRVRVWLDDLLAYSSTYKPEEALI